MGIGEYLAATLLVAVILWAVSGLGRTSVWLFGSLCSSTNLRLASVCFLCALLTRKCRKGHMLSSKDCQSEMTNLSIK